MLRKKIGSILSSKYWEYFIIFLILIYCLLVFVSFGLDDSQTDEITAIQRMIIVFYYVELVILILFAMEIIGNIYVYSIRV